MAINELRMEILIFDLVVWSLLLTRLHEMVVCGLLMIETVHDAILYLKQNLSKFLDCKVVENLILIVVLINKIFFSRTFS